MTNQQATQHDITPLAKDEAGNDQTTAAHLAYLIEEEKLAHDVYQVLGEKWGSRVFTNIQRSEATHQSAVLGVMQSRELTDPRQRVIGKFTHQDLQKLYDQLIAQGNKSASEAYAVGVTVETTDIADLEKAIKDLNAKDTDIKAVYDLLLSGSENHLRAFERQQSRTN